MRLPKISLFMGDAERAHGDSSNSHSSALPVDCARRSPQ
jgi:hypothetical protein